MHTIWDSALWQLKSCLLASDSTNKGVEVNTTVWRTLRGRVVCSIFSVLWYKNDRPLHWERALVEQSAPPAVFSPGGGRAEHRVNHALLPSAAGEGPLGPSYPPFLQENRWGGTLKHLQRMTARSPVALLDRPSVSGNVQCPNRACCGHIRHLEDAKRAKASCEPQTWVDFVVSSILSTRSYCPMLGGGVLHFFLLTCSQVTEVQVDR